MSDVELARVAKDAVDAGLFDLDPDAARANRTADSRYARMPSSLLDVPYVNGPIFIEVLGRDVPESAVFAVRRNFTEANRLLLPIEQVMSYFHQRFVSDDVLDSETTVRMVDAYRAPLAAEIDARESRFFRRELFSAGDIDIAEVTPAEEPLAAAEHIESRFKDPSLSFQIKGVDRKSHVRALYTRDEQVAGLKLVQGDPAVVLAILAYQGIIRDYLAELRRAFESMGTASASIREGLEHFDKYAEQWSTPNFTVELVPALAIFLHLRAESPNGARSRSVNPEHFRDAVNFIVANGAFRHWITAADSTGGQAASVHHFLCPAVGTVREQTQDGALLGALYESVARKVQAGDEVVTRLLDKVRSEASKRLAEADRTPTEQDLARLRDRVTMRIAYGRRSYTVALDASGLHARMGGTPSRNDVILTAPIGSWFYDVLREAVATTLDRKVAVFFQFNGRGYRLTPGKLIDFLRSR